MRSQQEGREKRLAKQNMKLREPPKGRRRGDYFSSRAGTQIHLVVSQKGANYKVRGLLPGYPSESLSSYAAMRFKRLGFGQASHLGKVVFLPTHENNSFQNVSRMDNRRAAFKNSQKPSNFGIRNPR